MPVTFAIVSWNTRELLGRCLASLAPIIRLGKAEAYVVDNGSSDGSPELVRTEAPWAQLVEPGRNLGFGAAVNLVARASTSEWLACANADIALEPGALEALLDAASAPRVGCVAPRLVLPDGQSQSSLFAFPTLPFTVALNLGLHRVVPSLRRAMLIPGLYELDTPRAVPWAVGAFLLLRREAFDAVGGFDERLWMYAEDLDLGWRLHDAGWITRYEPKARVRHASGAATEPAFGDQVRDRFMRATYAVILRRRGLLRTWITAAINVFGAAARLAWMWPLATFSRRWRGLLNDNRHWLVAHLQGLHSPRALVRENSRHGA